MYIPSIGKINRRFFTFIVVVCLVWWSAIKIGDHRAQIRAEEYARIAAAEATALAKRTAKVVNPEHLKCLATNIYHEAAGEPFMGQVAVARVVVNRIKHGFASNPCKVVYQKTVVPDLDNPGGVKTVCQFSWVCQGKDVPAKNADYLQAEQIAYKVLSENMWSEQIPGNILFFHNTLVEPRWGYRRVMKIGNHLFYSK